MLLTPTPYTNWVGHVPLPLVVVAVTVTGPAVDVVAGVALMLVKLFTVTFLAGAVPKLTVVPATKPVPVIVSGVSSGIGPEVLDRLPTVTP